MNASEFKLNLAVVVGINDYQNGIPPLGTAKQDAEAIATILQTNYQYKVHLLTESQATAQNLKQWLETDLPEAIKQDNPSRLLFYFAGHGIALNGDEGPQGYLIPQDAKLGEVSTYLPMQQVEAALTKLSCRHCLVILDCCFAGAFRWSSTRKLIPITETIHKERFDRFIQDPAWQVITSAASDQFALDNLDLKDDRGIARSNNNHSPFATALIEALSGSADAYPPAKNGKAAGDGIITATELYMYLRDTVEVPTDAKNQRQTPQIWCLKKHDKGEFIFLSSERELNLPPAPSLDELEDNNPYRGLLSYETKDSALFFGRTALINKLCDAMSDRPFTVVLGASGSGKSSLVKAGLIAHLDGSARLQQSANQRLKSQENPHVCKSRKWQILTPIRPGESPLNSLNGVLKELGNTEQLESKTLSELIASWSQSYPQTKLLLVIDQLEELITLCRNDAERRQFLDLLADLVQAYPEVVRLVVTLRSDFEPQLRTTSLEPLWQDGRFVVPAMTRDELRSVIEEPASAKVVYFESLDNRGYLVDQLIDEVAGMPGALPLLSFALSELYLKLARRYLEAQNTGDTVERAITWGDYDALGSVTKSLTQRADEVYEDLVKVDPVYDKTIRHVMLRMVAVGGELARRQVPESELQYPEPENGRVQEILSQFSAARLLVSGTDADNKPYIEPAHDALVRGWQKLLTWKKEEENLILQRRLTPAAEEWERAKNKDKEQPKGILDKAKPVLDWFDLKIFRVENLLSKIPARLARLLKRSQNQQGQPREKSAQFLWDSNPYLGVLDKELHSNENWLNQVEGEFVQESVLQKRRNISRRWRIAVGIISALSGLTVISLIQRNQAIQSQVNTLVTLSEGRASRHDQLGALLASTQAGAQLHHSTFTWIDAETRNRVITTMRDNLYSIQELNRFTAHRDKVTSVSFSPNGKMVASASEDGTVRLWRVDSESSHNSAPSKIVMLSIPGQRMTSASFSPDSQWVVTGGEDHKIRLWNLQGTSIQTFEKHQAQDGHQGNVTSVSFSPDGKMIASGSEDGTIQLRQLSGLLIKTFNQKAKITSIHFSPDGQTILAGDRDSKVKLWNVDGNLLKTFEGHADQVTGVNFGPDGHMIVSCSQDKTIKLWTLDGKLVKTFVTPSSIISVIISPDGQIIATGGLDRVIRVWDLNGTLLQNIQGHRDRVTSLSSSPNGQTIVSGSWDSTVRLWNLTNQKPKMLYGHTGEVWGVSFSPDGKWLVSAGGGNDDPYESSDKTIRLWTNNGQLVRILGQHRYRATSVHFSPNSQMIVSGGEEEGNNIRIWSVNNGSNQLFKILTGHSLGVWSVQFSPDGQAIASASKDQTIKLWSLDGTLLHTFIGHQAPVWGVSFSPDGKMLASASDDRTIKLWRLDGKLQKTFRGHEATVITVKFSPNGKVIASGSDDLTVRLWNSDGALIHKLKGHTGAITSLSFSPDGVVLASGSEDHTIKIWRVSDGRLLQTLQGHQNRVWGVDFKSTGNLLASASDDHTIIIWNFDHFDWNLNSDELLNRGCKWLQGYFDTSSDVTDEQRHLCRTTQ